MSELTVTRKGMLLCTADRRALFVPEEETDKVQFAHQGRSPELGEYVRGPWSVSGSVPCAEILDEDRVLGELFDAIPPGGHATVTIVIDVDDSGN